jgi:2-polyprenyl-6-methoxyphenol hydroxylase-like FAD-dependent oxidoreductase
MKIDDIRSCSKLFAAFLLSPPVCTSYFLIKTKTGSQSRSEFMMVANSMNVGIVGASVAGLSLANVLQRHGFGVQVFEAYPKGFERRGGALGSVDFQLTEKIRGDGSRCPRPPSRTGTFYGSLWKYFFEGLAPNTVLFDTPVKDVIDIDSDRPSILLGDGSLHPFDLVVGADGGGSLVRQHVSPGQEPKYAGYVLWRGLVKADGVIVPPSGQASRGPFHYETLGFPVVDADGEVLWNCGIYQALAPHYVQKVPNQNRQVGTAIEVPEWFLPVVDSLFSSRNYNFWKTCLEKGKISQHPIFEYGGHEVVRQRLLLVGDAAHMISPRTGSGAYGTMLDAVGFEDALDSADNNLVRALKIYGPDGRARSQDLLSLSHRVARQFRPSGTTDAPTPEELLIGHHAATCQE